MPKGSELAKAGCPLLGTPYSTLDCQAFVEKSLSKCGIQKNLKGSNAWYRFCIQNGWTGSPEECKAKFGSIPVGAFLFIHEFDGKEESRGYHDELGNASHIGIYTAMSGQEMVEIAVASGNGKAADYNFGNGAIHSSSSREHVATSKFAGKSISGGWNMIGLWKEISYGEPFDTFLNGGADPDPEAAAGVVWADSGTTVNMRTGPGTKYPLVEQIPIGAVIHVDSKGEEWSHGTATDANRRSCTGYMMTKFIRFGSEPVPGPHLPEDDLILVSRETLLAIYTQLGELLGRG